MPETLAHRARAEFDDKQNIKQDGAMGGNLETNTSSHFMSIQTLLCVLRCVDVCVNVAKT